MDMEVWSQQDMKACLNNFVLARINIDIDKQNASLFNVEGIPFVVISDFQGNQLIESLGFKDLKATQKLLRGFPSNVENIYRVLINHENMQDDAEANMEAAQAYQLQSESLSGDVKLTFIKQSNLYLGKAAKIASKQNETVLSEKIDLLKLLNKAELNTGKK